MVKYLFALWVGVLVYASLAMVFGTKGLSAHGQLLREQRRQEVNITNLMLLNRDLENTMNSLLYDEDTLAVYARKQGYGSGTERFIRIVGLGTTQRTRTYPGSVVAIAAPQYTPEHTIRIIALGIGITILICMAIFDLLRFIRER